MKRLILFVFLLYGINLFSQDIDFYLKNYTDKYKYEDINTQMSFHEYSLLSRNLRMKEMMYATMVPGYIHFWAKDYKTGYVLLGTRLFAYGEMAFIYFDIKNHFKLEKWKNIFGLGLDGASEYLKNRIKLYGALSISSMILITGGYVFDWIHGQYRLQKKQELIRYKYNMKLNLSLVPYTDFSTLQSKNTLGLSLALQF